MDRTHAPQAKGREKMPMLKRMILLFLTLTALFLAGQTVTAAESGALTVTVETTKSPVRGQDFTVNIELENNPGLTSLDLTLRYDSAVMTLRSAEFADFLTGTGIQCSRNGNSLKITSASPLSRDGVWITLTFRLGENVGLGEYPITLTASAAGSGGTLRPTPKSGGVVLECEHDYHATETAQPTCSSEGFTVYRCRKCSTTYITDYVDKIPHTWGSSSTAEATCTHPATLTHTCRVCGEIETVETAPALGHNYVRTVVEPTCTREGYTLYQCSRCDESYQRDVLPTVDHRYTKTYEKPATCSETGYELYACVFCGLSYSQTIPTLEHHWEVEAVAATHTHGGWSLYTCDACGLSMRGDFTDPLVYDYEYTVETEPGCTTPGVRIGICSDGCGHTVREEIPPTGHTFGEWEQIRTATLYRTGRWRNVCTVCGYTVESSTPKLVSGDSQSEPQISVFSATFWLGVLNRMKDNLLTTALIGFAVLLVFLMILTRRIYRVYRQRRDPSVKELERIAEGVEGLPPGWNSAPEGIGNEFCHDYQDFGLPSDDVIAEAHRILNEKLSDELHPTPESDASESDKSKPSETAVPERAEPTAPETPEPEPAKAGALGVVEGQEIIEGKKP